MEHISSNQTGSVSPILEEAILKITSMSEEKLKFVVVALFIQLCETAGLYYADDDASWDSRHVPPASQVQAMMNSVIELGLKESMLQPLLDLVTAFIDTRTKDSRLLMTDRSGDKLRLSKSWSAAGSLQDGAQKTIIITISKVLQTKRISRDQAHRMLAATLKAFGQKGTDRSIAKWEKDYDAALPSARIRRGKKVRVAERVRNVTAPQIGNALSKANWSADAIEKMLIKVSWNLEVLQEEALFVENEINKAIAEMEDWSIERVLETFVERLKRLKAAAPAIETCH